MASFAFLCWGDSKSVKRSADDLRQEGVTPYEKNKEPFVGSLFFGSPCRARTNDPAVNSRMLCQLSYGGIKRTAQSFDCAVSASTYFSGRLPSKYLRHKRA